MNVHIQHDPSARVADLAPTFSNARHIAHELITVALRAVDPAEAVRRVVRVDGPHLIIGATILTLEDFRRIFVVGAGKASAPMARALEEVLGDRITAGCVNVKHGYTDHTATVVLTEAGHPVPDRSGITGTARMLEMLENATSDDLVLCVISGGGSALMLAPESGISLEDYQILTDLLLRSGADITRINTVRKHIERVKGGRLAQIAAPARCVSLVLSDVVGNPLDFIASGPTVPDTTTFADAWQVLQDFDLVGNVPTSIEQHLARGVRGEIPETPKPGDTLFDLVTTIVVGSNEIAAEAAITRASELGLNTLHLTSFLEGEAREAARFVVAIGREILIHQRPIQAPGVVVLGGETTVTVRGTGRGGRNQELALAAVAPLRNVPRTLLVTLATDGSDGPTDAAGGFADCGSATRLEAAGVDLRTALANNASYDALLQAGDLIRVGPTNTNVNDLTFVFVFRE